MHEDLHARIRGEIDAAPETIKNYSHDASIFKVIPEAVIYPNGVEDLQALVHYAEEKRAQGVNVSLTPRNKGTCMSGGSLTESYVVDMSRHFDQVSEVDLEKGSIWAQGGAMHLKVEEGTHPHGVYFPPYTSSRDLCGIGGMIGNNASGEKSVKYGPTSANVKKLKVVLSNGEHVEMLPITPVELEEKKKLMTLEGHLYRQVSRIIDENWDVIQKNHPKTKKNVAGYALWEVWNSDKTLFNLGRLFVGAQGTLGFVTDAELRVIPKAAFNRMIVSPISQLQDLTPIVKSLLTFEPDTCETFDKFTYALAKQYHPKESALAHVAEGQHMIVFGIYAGTTQEEADSKADAARKAIEGLGYTVAWIEDQETIDSYLLIRRKSFKLLLENPRDDMRAMPFIEDTIVPIEHYGEFIGALEAILSEYHMTYTYAGHIGDGSIRLVPLTNMELPGAQEMIWEVSRRVYDLVFAFGGSMSVDHNDGLARTPFLERMYGPEMVELFAEVKSLFDPNGIFNPGKKVGGSHKYSIDHIVKTNKG